MDEPDITAVVTDGIYTTCDICFAIVAHNEGHIAWHLSRNEGTTDANS